MKKKILLMIALLCAMVQGMKAQNGILCTASDKGRVICTDGSIYDNVSTAQAAGKTPVAMIIWVDETNKKGLALHLKDDWYYNNTEGAERCNQRNTFQPVAGATWKLASKDEWQTMVDAYGGYQQLRDGFGSVGGANLNTNSLYTSSTAYEKNSAIYWLYNFRNDDGWYKHGWQLSKTDLSGHLRPCLAFNLLTLYEIKNQNDWFTFCSQVNGGDTFSDKYVKITAQDEYIPIVSEMAGVDDARSFQGLFDGNGHTLTFNVSITATENYCAPFRHVKNAIIKNLRINGIIHTQAMNAAGFVGESHGALTITNCRSSVEINSTKNGDGTHGGFVATLSGKDNTVLIDGCVFDGSFATSNGTVGCGGFIGWGVYNKPTIKNSLMKPSRVDANMVEKTFARWYTGDNGIYEPTITNCYYIATTNLTTNQGTQAYTATAPANLGDAVEDYGMVKAYQNGILVGGTYYVVPATVTLADNADNSTTINDANGYFADVTLSGRTLYKDGAWNTICLPFNLTLSGSPLDGAVARPLTSASISGTTLNLTFGDAVDKLVAGTPYIIKWASGDDIVNPVFTGVTIDKNDRSYDNGAVGNQRVRFTGTYKSTPFDSEDKSILLLGGKNTLYYPTTGAGIGAQRAYFKLGSEAALARLTSFNIDFGEGEVTGIIGVREVREANDNSWYSIDGRKLDGKPTKKGVYINNGRRIVIK